MSKDWTKEELDRASKVSRTNGCMGYEDFSEALKQKLPTIESFEEAIAGGKDYKNASIKRTMHWAYRTAQEDGNTAIDFNDVIWDTDVEPIVNTCWGNGIIEFTISSTFSGLITTLAAFEEHGCVMTGLTTVNDRGTDWRTGERRTIPAIRMEVR